MNIPGQHFDDPDNKGALVRLDDSSWAERDVFDIVQRVSEYDPNLRVQYLKEAESIGDAPYRIIELCSDGKWRVVFYTWVLDERVLHRLYLADTARSNVLNRLDANNNAIRREQQRRYEDRLGEATDIAKTMISSRKGRWSVDLGDKVLKLDDDPMRKAIVEEKE